MAHKPELSVIIPAYNEEARLLPTLEALRAVRGPRGGLLSAQIEILVVCDGCTDGTATVAADWARATGCDLKVVAYSPNRGKGYALRQGVRLSRGRWVAFMDADGSTPPGELLRLLPPIRSGRADIVIASRRVADSDIVQPQTTLRRAMGAGFAALVRFVAGLPYRDTQCGFKVFSGTAARTLFAGAVCDDFSIDVEILVAARRLGYRVEEHGVTWRDDPDSRVSPVRDSLRMAAYLLRERLSARGRTPRRRILVTTASS